MLMWIIKKKPLMVKLNLIKNEFPIL